MTTKINQFPSKSAIPAHPKDISFTIKWTPQGMEFKVSRPSNAIEIASIALAMCGSQLQIIAEQFNKSAVTLNSRSEPHVYIVNEDSEKSVRGLACGLCGATKESSPHVETISSIADDDSNIIQ